MPILQGAMYATCVAIMLIGGRDVREYDLAVLRDAVAVVLQNTTLFSGTIRENLAWGDPDADDGRMLEACRLACADEFLDRIGGLDGVLGQGGANLLGTYMIKPVVNAIEDGDPQRFLAGVAFTAGIYLTGVVACFGYSQIMVRVAQKVVSDIRRDLFARIERLPLSFFDRTRHGDVMSCFTNDVDTVSEALNNSFANLVQAGVQIVGTITLLLVLDWRLTLITLVCDGAIALYVRFSGGRSSRHFARQQTELAGVDGYVEEMILGQKVVKVFNHEGANLARFRTLNGRLREAGVAAQTYASTMVPVTVCVSYANYAIVTIVGAVLAINGYADVGSLASYLVFVRQAAAPFNQFTQQGNFLLTALAGAGGRRGRGAAGAGRSREHRRRGGRGRRLGVGPRRVPHAAAGRRAFPPRGFRLRAGPSGAQGSVAVRQARADDRLRRVHGRRPAGADPRRGHLVHRHPHRGADPTGHGRADERPHGVRHRASTLHRAQCRCDHRA